MIKFENSIWTSSLRQAIASLTIISLCLISSGNWLDQDIAHAVERVQSPHRAASPLENYCPKGTRLIDAISDVGNICEPQGSSPLQRITICLSAGMEAVVIPDRSGIVCMPYRKGEAFLDKKVDEKNSRYQHPDKIEAREICEKRFKPGADKRILGRRTIKDLVRESGNSIDPTGIRLIGAIFCDGVDLIGLRVPYSLILDRSVVAGDIQVRNLRTRGDLSFDNSVVYGQLRISRSEISGSIYTTFAFIEGIEIGDSTIGGSLKINRSVIPTLLNIENVSIAGDVDLTASFISQLAVLKNKVAGVLDLSQSQARCSYDIRKNDIGDIVAAQIGFGIAKPSWTNEARVAHIFKRITNDSAFGRPLRDFRGDSLTDPYDRYIVESSITNKSIPDDKVCEAINLIKPGTFVLVDNDIKSSICLRSFNWMSDSGFLRPSSNIYLNENTVGNATWLDFAGPPTSGPTKRFERKQDSSEHMLSIFNVRTGTLVLNFDLTTQDVLLKVNGLRFERVYTSKDKCESALSLRSTRLPGAGDVPFPPDLRLPKVEQVIEWIKKNSYAGTQQPFAEFVAVFERAGDSEAAKKLKIQAENFAVMSSLCKVLPSAWFDESLCDSDAASSKLDEKPESNRWTILNGLQWIGHLFVVSLKFILWGVAQHGYRPENAVLIALSILAAAWALFRWGFKIVGYSVEGVPDKFKPISFVFLFDRMLPAYRIRGDYYKKKQFYVLPAKSDNRETRVFKHRGGEWRVAEASDVEAQKAELILDIIRFLGLVLAVFLIAALGRLVR